MLRESTGSTHSLGSDLGIVAVFKDVKISTAAVS